MNALTVSAQRDGARAWEGASHSQFGVQHPKASTSVGRCTSSPCALPGGGSGAVSLREPWGSNGKVGAR